MKKNLKRFAKTFSLFLAISLLLFNCQTDDSHNDSIQLIEKNKPNFQISRINYPQVKQNPNVISKLAEITNEIKSKRVSTLNKTVYFDDLGFFIETDEAIYIESSDGSYHSYTFPIYRNVDNGLTENLLLSYTSEGTYRAYLVTYDITEEEKELIKNGVQIDLIDKMDMTFIDGIDWETNEANKVYAGCVSIGLVTELLCHDSDGNVIQDTSGQSNNGCVGMSWNETYLEVTIDQACLASSGGNEDNNTNTNDNDDTSNTNQTDNDNYDPGTGSPSGSNTSSNDNVDATALALSEAKKQRKKDFLYNQLNPEQYAWFMSQNPDIQASIFNYLEDQLNSDGLVPLDTPYYADEDIDTALQFIEILSLPVIQSDDLIDYVEQILRMLNHLRQFGNIEDEIYADYIESLIPDFNTMTLGEVHDIYLQVKQTCNNLTLKYLEAIVTPIVTDLVIPVVTYALIEATAGTAITLIQRIPVTMVLQGTRLNSMVRQVGLLGVQGSSNSIRIVTCASSPYTRALELFLSLTRNAESIVVHSNGTRVANMGGGNIIRFRPASASSSNFPATIDLDFPSIWTTVRSIKFQ